MVFSSIRRRDDTFCGRIFRVFRDENTGLQLNLGILMSGVIAMIEVIINREGFTERVLNAKTPVLVDFWAEWCGPCRMMSPVLERLAEGHPEVRVVKVNVDEQPELAAQYRVTAIPTLVLFRDGQAAASCAGARPLEELERMLRIQTSVRH